ncbi:DUF599 family protein [Gemmobacter lanyuensis]
MDALTLIRLFTPADMLALGYSLAGAALLQHAIESPRFPRPSVSQIMAHYRRDWMREMVTRQPRIFDATILDGLRQGITFYASSCLIGLGGGWRCWPIPHPCRGWRSAFSCTATRRC